MAKALHDLGFEIIDAYDLNRTAMGDKTSEFARRAKTADLAFVYYSGHEIQYKGRNYLVPIDGRMEDRHDLRRMVQLDLLTEGTSTAKKAILVVDACPKIPRATVRSRVPSASEPAPLSEPERVSRSRT